jgi:hypothetical protein
VRIQSVVDLVHADTDAGAGNGYQVYFVCGERGARKIQLVKELVYDKCCITVGGVSTGFAAPFSQASDAGGHIERRQEKALFCFQE